MSLFLFNPHQYTELLKYLQKPDQKYLNKNLKLSQMIFVIVETIFKRNMVQEEVLMIDQVRVSM